MKRWSHIALAALFVAGASGWFLLSTVLLDELPDALLILGVALASLLLVLAMGLPSRQDLSALRPPSVGYAALAGVLMLVVAPGIVLANRFTDAPPGSETLFLTTAGWVLPALIAAALVPRQRPTARQVAFLATGVLGVATILANWERPSSFSPFIRYPSQDVAFLVAGVAWAAGAVLLLRGRSAKERRALTTISALVAVVAAALYLVISGGVPDLALLSPRLGVWLAASVSYAAFFIAWALLSQTAGIPAAASLWLLPAVVITGFGAFEQVFSPRGPDPVVGTGAFAGIALAILGCLGTWLSARADEAQPPATTRPKVAVLAVVLSAASLAVAVIALGLPAIRATVNGSLTSGQAYSAQWNLLGYETAGGWAAVVAGGLLLSLSLHALSNRRLWRVLGAVGAGVIALAAYWFVASTPLHTWTRWVPVEIQSEYGTEYTLLQFAVVHQPVRIAALALGAAAAVALLVSAFTALRSSQGEDVPSEVSE